MCPTTIVSTIFSTIVIEHTQPLISFYAIRYSYTKWIYFFERPLPSLGYHREKNLDQIQRAAALLNGYFWLLHMPKNLGTRVGGITGSDTLLANKSSAYERSAY